MSQLGLLRRREALRPHGAKASGVGTERVSWQVSLGFFIGWVGYVPHGTGPLDRLALPHWCVHSSGGVITNTVQDRGARC